MADTNRPVNDDAIDRALREALDVSPSPEFLARVRMRIAKEPAPRSTWMTWMPVAAGALAAAIVVMVVVGPRMKGDTKDVRLNSNTSADVPLPVTTPPSPSSVAPSTALGAGSRTNSAYTSRVRLKPDTAYGRTPEPEVLIAQAEAAALRRLFMRAGEGLVSGASPVTDAGAAAGTAGVVLPPDLTIAPLKIEPLVPVNGEEGVRQ